MSKLTPFKSIRKYCLWCAFDSFTKVKECSNKACPLYPFRFGKSARGRRLKAIRYKCLDCSGFTYVGVTSCKYDNCSLFYWRFGKNPRLKGRRNMGSGTKGLGKWSKSKNHNVLS